MDDLPRLSCKPSPNSDGNTSLIERLIRPEEIADTVTFLYSGKASSVNGAVFRVDGSLVHHII
jgi:3-oxoacyl-[acyl-carrier protein] reductase